MSKARAQMILDLEERVSKLEAAMYRLARSCTEEPSTCINHVAAITEGRGIGPTMVPELPWEEPSAAVVSDIKALPSMSAVWAHLEEGGRIWWSAVAGVRRVAWLDGYALMTDEPSTILGLTNTQTYYICDDFDEVGSDGA